MNRQNAVVIHSKQLYSYTFIKLYVYIIIQLYVYIVIQLYNYIVIQLYGYIFIKLYRYIVTQLYSIKLYVCQSSLADDQLAKPSSQLFGRSGRSDTCYLTTVWPVPNLPWV